MKTGEAEKRTKAIELYRKLRPALLAGVVAIILIVFGFARLLTDVGEKMKPRVNESVMRNVVPGPTIWLKGDTIITVPLRMDQYSRLIHLPPGGVKFQIDITDTDGDGQLHGVCFPDGTEWDRETLLRYLKERDGWFSQIPSSFRLLGKGVATITVKQK